MVNTEDRLSQPNRSRWLARRAWPGRAENPEPPGEYIPFPETGKYAKCSDNSPQKRGEPLSERTERIRLFLNTAVLPSVGGIGQDDILSLGSRPRRGQAPNRRDTEVCLRLS